MRVLYGFWWSSSVLCLVLVVNQWPASHWSVTEFAVLVVVESGNKAWCPLVILADHWGLVGAGYGAHASSHSPVGGVPSGFQARGRSGRGVTLDRSASK